MPLGIALAAALKCEPSRVCVLEDADAAMLAELAQTNPQLLEELQQNPAEAMQRIAGAMAAGDIDMGDMMGMGDEF